MPGQGLLKGVSYDAAEVVAASVLTEAAPTTPATPAGREIPVQAPTQALPEAEGTPPAPAAADQATEAVQEAPEEATRAEAAPHAAEPEEATGQPAAYPPKE